MTYRTAPETAIFTSEKSSKCNGKHHAFGSVSPSETRLSTSKWSFKAKVKHSLKHLYLELGPKFLSAIVCEILLG